MALETGLFIFKKIWACITAIFWKNKSIVYLNSNKKSFNLEEACRSKCINVKDSKVIVLGKNLPTSYKMYRTHFKKMKYRLFQIKRNLKENIDFTYGGFVSPMFAVFDGMQIGNTTKLNLVCYDNNKNSYYSILYSRKSRNSPAEIECSDVLVGNEINIVISSTYKISPSKYNASLKTFELEDLTNNKIDNKYLQKVYQFVESVLVWSQTRNIKRINMYISAKQPVSFVVGTAIEERHPEIIVYEYLNNEYAFSLNLKTFKIVKTI